MGQIAEVRELQAVHEIFIAGNGCNFYPSYVLLITRGNTTPVLEGCLIGPEATASLPPPFIFL